MTDPVSIAPLIAWPWRLRMLGPTDCRRSAECIHCGRGVAVAKPSRAVCIYCAIDRGVAPEDGPIE